MKRQELFIGQVVKWGKYYYQIFGFDIKNKKYCFIKNIGGGIKRVAINRLSYK